MTSLFEYDRLYLDSEGQWFSGALGDPISALTPIEHQRTKEMLWKAITLPAKAEDKPHLEIHAAKQTARYEFEWQDSPDIILSFEELNPQSKTQKLRLLGPKILEFAIPKEGLIVTINKAIPFLLLEPTPGVHVRLKISRQAWAELMPYLPGTKNFLSIVEGSPN